MDWLLAPELWLARLAFERLLAVVYLIAFASAYNQSQSLVTYHLDLRFERTETAGPVFDELRASLDAIGALMHMDDVFALRSADVYRVVGARRVGDAT